MRSGRRLAAAQFFQALPASLREALPARLGRFDARRTQGVIKFHYGHSETHYEAWHHSGIGRIEVGLHFEGDRGLNAAALEFFRARMVEVKGGLPLAELEPWDRGWARLYETFPTPDLDTDAVAESTHRLAAYIVTLQPLLDHFWSEFDGPA